MTQTSVGKPVNAYQGYRLTVTNKKPPVLTVCGLLLLNTLFVSGCGQKGALYLPPAALHGDDPVPIIAETNQQGDIINDAKSKDNHQVTQSGIESIEQY